MSNDCGKGKFSFSTRTTTVSVYILQIGNPNFQRGKKLRGERFHHRVGTAKPIDIPAGMAEQKVEDENQK